MMPVPDPNLELAKYYQEWWKAGISALTPITIAFLTYFVTGALNEKQSELRRGEQISVDKQKIYASLGPCLNIIYIYIVDYGDYAAYTPDQILSKKRESDRYFFTYRPYWSENTVKSYQSFMNAAFATFTGFASDAKIRSASSQKKEALKKRGVSWQEAWSKVFTEEVDRDITDIYYSLAANLLYDAATSTINAKVSMSKDLR